MCVSSIYSTCLTHNRLFPCGSALVTHRLKYSNREGRMLWDSLFFFFSFFFQFCIRCLDTAYFAVIFIQRDKTCRHKSLWNWVERKTLRLGSFCRSGFEFFWGWLFFRSGNLGERFSQYVQYQMSVWVSILLPSINWEVYDTKENNKIVLAIGYKRLMGVFFM